MKYLITLLLAFCSNFVLAQVQIVAEQDQNRDLTLLGLNSDKIPYTIRLEFILLENLESLEGDILFKTANPGKSTLVKLQSIYSNEKTGFRYNTKLFKGDIFQRPLYKTIYLPPVKEGTKFNMRPLRIESHPSQNSGLNTYTGSLFLFEKAVAICAPRKGIVSEIKMERGALASGPSNFESENFIEIYHEDGSFSRLSGLQKNSAKVEIGDTVFPGQEIAESAIDPNQNLHHVKMIQSHWEMSESGMLWVNFPVVIFSEQKNISSDQDAEDILAKHPENIIQLEMDKKELKKYSKK
ncbi:hypothetical protein SAMN04488519_11168 [Algoriphagus ornithinivorans]|uniref:Peptidase family M23 n=1 Tax=Algoriphagus ornithinivorans TaxID=226506 RepID=A0A1I5J4U6_9BACT|nr:hypothetical protein [Algoriphagus ornithinivorans]SFO67633.1 hypothetical protein SAMN04488519_11168 [Algoriphagus ornithinivorans]